MASSGMAGASTPTTRARLPRSEHRRRPGHGRRATNFNRNQYNVVTQGHRQPGSSFKAFVYTAAIDSEGWSP